MKPLNLFLDGTYVKKLVLYFDMIPQGHNIPQPQPEPSHLEIDDTHGEHMLIS
jgi:hypothetical protein